MITSTGIIIAIDSAIAGGSIALFRDEVEIDNWIGSASVSKAEDLLFNIDVLLTNNNIERKEIDMIAVSAGPGSFTGIRIGIATALGLKAGLGIEMSSESALKAMVHTSANAKATSETITAALPVGRDAVCIQTFRVTSDGINPLDEPHTITYSSLELLAVSESTKTLILHGLLYEKIEVAGSNVLNFGHNLARAIGIICRTNCGAIAEPLFISKSF